MPDHAYREDCVRPARLMRFVACHGGLRQDCLASPSDLVLPYQTIRSGF